MENELGNILNYVDAEFGLSIIKKKGKSNTMQMYKFSQSFEILVCIASMTEQLIKQKVATEQDIKEAVEMGARKANAKL